MLRPAPVRLTIPTTMPAQAQVTPMAAMDRPALNMASIILRTLSRIGSHDFSTEAAVTAAVFVRMIPALSNSPRIRKMVLATPMAMAAEVSGVRRWMTRAYRRTKIGTRKCIPLASVDRIGAAAPAARP